MQKYLWIALGGATGAMLRYAIGAVAIRRFGPRFPMGTFWINLSACFLIGFVIEFLNYHSNVNSALRYLVAIGFIGAYSTFSTFEYEAWADFTRGAYWIALLYVTASVAGGFVMVAAGAATARTVR